MEGFQWTCPFCNRPTTMVESNIHVASTYMDIPNKDGPRKVTLQFTVCPNPECNRFAFRVSLYKIEWEASPTRGRWIDGEQLKEWMLIPPSKAKVFPSFVPKPILDNYTEACLIENLSPKASATLSRRCLQGMIRDFWKVKGRNLKQEIDLIKDKVDPLTWKAIEAVKNIGNIGAHMEKDINLIIDVEPDEASQLIYLIETLIKDWYINRDERQRKLMEIIKTAHSKESKKKR